MKHRNLSLTILGEPKAVQSVRACRMGNTIRQFQPKKVTDWKAYIRLSATEQLPDGWTPLTGAVEVEYTFVFPILKSMNKKTVQAITDGLLLFKDRKPDIDNLQKGLADSLTGVVWMDDSQIVETHASKIFGVVPQIKVNIYEKADSNLQQSMRWKCQN